MNESLNNVRFGNNISFEDKPFIDTCAICLIKKKIEFSCYICETCKICKKCMYNFKIYKRDECPTCQSEDWLRCTFFDFDTRIRKSQVDAVEENNNTMESSVEEITDDEDVVDSDERREEEHQINKIMSRYLENRVRNEYSIHVLDDNAHYRRLENDDDVERNINGNNSRTCCECNVYTAASSVVIGGIAIYLITMLKNLKPPLLIN